MTRVSVLTLIAVLAAFAAAGPTADAGGALFEFTAPGGDILDDTVNVFPGTFGDAKFSIPELELEITGLTHGSAEDLDIYLIDPFGAILEVMTDQGGMGSIDPAVNLIFNDNAAGQVGDPIVSGTYLPDAGSFAMFDNGGTDAWMLFVIDDSLGETGSFESYTLRVIPEPATLCLLALGAAAGLRRRRS